MAFSLSAIVNDVTYSLTDGNPFSLDSADGLAAPDVARLTERGPLQQGASDLGFRLRPRVVTLALTFYASSASGLDTHRSTLARIFQPTESTPITLSVTRDDGETRTLNCYTIAGTDIEIVRDYRPGNLHKAVVQVRANDPFWYGSPVVVENGGIGDLYTAYTGTVPAYPIITFGNPPADLTITHMGTGVAIVLTGLTASNAGLIIDLTGGNKTVKRSDGTSAMSAVSVPADLLRFKLLPAPDLASGGNLLTMSVPLPSSARIEYTPRFWSF